MKIHSQIYVFIHKFALTSITYHLDIGMRNCEENHTLRDEIT